MTKIIGVYKITNIVNNKVYIGSSINMKKRSRLCNTNSRKKIILSNLNGEILKKYESLTKASEDLGIKLYVISNILRKKRNNVGNYTFKYDK